MIARQTTPPDLRVALETFERAYAYVERANLLAEVEWQASRSFPDFTEADLLREAAWVILCSGFRESVVRKIFDYISLCFCDWESSQAIVRSAPLCRASAMSSIQNIRKLDAIVGVAQFVDEVGFNLLKSSITNDPIHHLQKLAYIGPATAYHLAKNLGVAVAKPDRHLVRLSGRLGYDNVQELCTSIAAETGIPISVVDLVLWRYLADHSAVGPESKQAR